MSEMEVVKAKMIIGKVEVNMVTLFYGDEPASTFERNGV